MRRCNSVHHRRDKAAANPRDQLDGGGSGVDNSGMEPLQCRVHRLGARMALGAALMFAVAGAAPAMSGPAAKPAPEPAPAVKQLRVVEAMVQPAALVYAQFPRLQMDRARGRLRLICALDNRGDSYATAVQMQVMVFNAKRQLVAGSSFPAHGLSIAPGGREVKSVLLARLLTLSGRGKLRYVVFVTGGTGARIWWRDTAMLQQFSDAARFGRPLFADGITTGPASERHPQWEALPAD